MSAPADPGLQIERTTLAWQRTCLALVVGGLLLGRLKATHLGAAGPALGAVALASLGYVAVNLRYRRAHTALPCAGELESDGFRALLVSTATLAAATRAVVLA